MKRYADIAHYRAPYKDVMLSGLGADAPAAAPAAQVAAPQLSPKLAEAYRAAFAMTSPDSDGLAVVKPADLENTLAAAAMFKGDFQPSVSGILGFVQAAADATYTGQAFKEPSMLDFIAAMTGRGSVPSGFAGKLVPNKDAYVLMYYGQDAAGNVVPVFASASKEFATAVAKHASNPLYFVVLKPGQKLSDKAQSLLKAPLSEGLSTAAMLGYGAIGLAAAAGIFMLLGGKKKKFEANPKRKKKARKVKRAKKAAHKPRRVR